MSDPVSTPELTPEQIAIVEAFYAPRPISSEQIAESQNTLDLIGTTRAKIKLAILTDTKIVNEE